MLLKSRTNGSGYGGVALFLNETTIFNFRFHKGVIFEMRAILAMVLLNEEGMIISVQRTFCLVICLLTTFPLLTLVNCINCTIMGWMWYRAGIKYIFGTLFFLGDHFHLKDACVYLLMSQFFALHHILNLGFVVVFLPISIIGIAGFNFVLRTRLSAHTREKCLPECSARLLISGFAGLGAMEGRFCCGHYLNHGDS